MSGVARDTTTVPNFDPYRTQKEEAGRTFSYMVVGSMGLLTAAGAKSLVTDFLANMSASADVLALAKVEVEMGNIPEGASEITSMSSGLMLRVSRAQARTSSSRSVALRARPLLDVC